MLPLHMLVARTWSSESRPILKTPQVLTFAIGLRAAYLRHRLNAAWASVGLGPAPERPQHGQAPRLGRTGLGTLGPRSATPITPFRVRDC